MHCTSRYGLGKQRRIKTECPKRGGRGNELVRRIGGRRAERLREGEELGGADRHL